MREYNCWLKKWDEKINTAVAIERWPKHGNLFYMLDKKNINKQSMQFIIRSYNMVL
jgi:hypothetical protein